jgi:hypothetical protein
MYVRELSPFDVDSHRVRAFLNRARWIIEIDGVQTDGGLNGRFHDTEEFVRQYVTSHARFKLAGTTRYYPLGVQNPAMGDRQVAAVAAPAQR